MRNTLVIFSLLFMASCIGDDIISDTVAEKVVIINPIDSLELNTAYFFSANFLNQIGELETRSVTWSSSDPSVLIVDPSGLAAGVALGVAEVVASVEGSSRSLEARQMVTVAQKVSNPGNFERKGTLRTTSSYALSGDFVLKRTNGELFLEFSDNYNASTSLPGLYIYLTNNPGTTSNALELGMVTVFKGAHSYTLPQDVERNTYSHVLYFCKPFGVKVGDGAFEN